MGDIELFRCDRHPGGLTLTTSACAELWKRGRFAEPWRSVWHCRGCEIGRVNAGEAPAEPVYKHGHEPGCRVCHNRHAKRVYGLLCISCYNRILEAIKGRSGRASVPQKIRGEDAHGLVHVRAPGVCVYTVRARQVSGEKLRFARQIVVPEHCRPAQASLFPWMPLLTPGRGARPPKRVVRVPRAIHQSVDMMGTLQ